MSRPDTRSRRHQRPPPPKNEAAGLYDCADALVTDTSNTHVGSRNLLDITISYLLEAARCRLQLMDMFPGGQINFPPRARQAEQTLAADQEHQCTPVPG